MATLFLLLKLFFFLRISKVMTKLVIMITTVFADLITFLYFFTILVIMLSIIIGILGLGDHNKEGKRVGVDDDEDEKRSIYSNVPRFLRNIYMIIRFSFGDFEFGGVKDLNDFEKNMFWITWLFIVLI